MSERTTEITKIFSCMTVQSPLMIPVFNPGRFIFFWFFFFLQECEEDKSALVDEYFQDRVDE